jgi:hypothetical protein
MPMPTQNPASLPKGLAAWAVKQLAAPEGLLRVELTRRVERQYRWGPWLKDVSGKPVTKRRDAADARCIRYWTTTGGRKG